MLLDLLPELGLALVKSGRQTASSQAVNKQELLVSLPHNMEAITLFLLQTRVSPPSFLPSLSHSRTMLLEVVEQISDCTQTNLSVLL